MTVVHLAIEGSVAEITLTGPGTRNALDEATADGLIQACDAIDGAPEVAAAVLKGADGTFCSGADRKRLVELKRDTSPSSGARWNAFTETIYEAILRVSRLRVPLIAAVRGAAVGAGLNLAMATDLRVISTTGRLVSGFTKAGLHPGGGHFALLSRLAGSEAAVAMGIFGQEVTGGEAKQLGLAWEVCDDKAVEARALVIAETVAGNPALARSSIKSLRAQVGPPQIPLTASMQLDIALQGLCRAAVSPDA